MEADAVRSKHSKFTILILMIMILSFVLIACHDNRVIPSPIEDEEGQTSPVVSANKNQLLKKISNGMLWASDRMEEEPERYVSSVYTIHTGYINYTIEYKANYALKLQNSEIYAKIFDNNYHTNRIFVYYNKGDLFLQLQDEKKSMKEFGSTSAFDLFYELVTMLDMSDKLISPAVSEIFNPDNIGKNIGALIDQSRMTHIKVSEIDARESIEMTGIDFGYGDIIPSINKMIVDTFDKFEDKFDLLSLKYLGLRISDLANLEIATMKGERINVRLDNNCTNTVILEAYGDMTDGINTFTLDVEVEAKPGKGKIVIDDTESPYLNKYPEVVLGRFNYGGTLFVPFLDMTYDAKLRTILSSTDNTINQIVFTLNTVHDEIGGLFYKDQMMYIDIKGINDQLNGAIELNKLNLPRVKFANLDLAQEITLLINDALKIVQSFKGGDEYGEAEELMQTVLDNIVSNEEDNTISITITQELIQQLYGEDVDLFDLLAQKIGVTSDILAQIFGDDVLKDARLIFIYNVETGAIGVDLYSGDNLLFQLRLNIIPPLDVDVLPYPQSFNPNNYHWLEIPDNTILSMRGTLEIDYTDADPDTTQEMGKVYFDKLFGALLGDVTGVNTPYVLYSKETLEFHFDVMQIYDYEEDSLGDLVRTITSTMKFELYKKDVLQLGVYSSSDPDYILVHFNVPIGPKGEDREGVPYQQRTLKYKIKREKVSDAFDDFLGPGNIFSTPNVMDVLTRMIRVLDESVSMRLRFQESSFAFNLIPEKVYEFIGIENLTSIVKARVKFAMSPEEYLNVNVVESDFVIPNVRPLDNDEFESIYVTQWQEYVYTFFGDEKMRFKLSYLEDSVKIISGNYHYKPKAKLLDTVVMYNVIIQDIANGTKIVENILDPEMPRNANAVLNVNYPLSIDPSRYTELPSKIPAHFDDYTFGYVDYVIEGFDVSNINVSGMPRATYLLIVGKNSVAEQSFEISVEVLGRVIVPLTEVINGHPTSMHHNGIPVVDEVTIDPYTFALRRLEDASWTPLKSSMVLRFAPVDNVSQGQSITITDIDWDFDFEDIKYNGGIFYTHSMYNRLPIAVKVNVKTKLVDYLWFVDRINTNTPIADRPFTETVGQFTVDVLESETYVFPTASTEKHELRLYFKDGTYRIIGNKDHNPNDNAFYNTYLPLTLDWKYSQVEPNVLRLEGTKAPLGMADKDINTTTIGANIFSIGEQQITLKILMPSRAEGTIGTMDATAYAIIGYERFSNNEYDYDNPIREHCIYEKASFSADMPLGSFLEYNPYNQLPLPDTVYLNVEQGGMDKFKIKGYKVRWIEDDVLMARDIYDDNDNLINTHYLLRNVFTNEELLLVRGVLGDGNHTIEVRMIVRNIEAVYQGITFEGMAPNVTTKIVDPYLNYSLPSYYILLLKNADEIFVNNVEWYIVLKPNQKWMFQLNGKSYHWIFDYLEYIDAINAGEIPPKTLDEIIPLGFHEPTAEETTYYRLLLERGEIPIDNRFVFAYQGGDYTLKSYIDATESVIAQEIYLTLEVLPRNILIVDSNNGYTQIDFFNQSDSEPKTQFVLDTYMKDSATILERLDFLYRTNGDYEETIKLFNTIFSDIKKLNPELDVVSQYALAYDKYYIAVNSSERSYLGHLFDRRYNANPAIGENELKYTVMQEYLQEKEDLMQQMRVGLYFGDYVETAMNKYELIVYWINIEDIIQTLISSEGAVLGLELQGYIGYGQINQQLIKLYFRIYRREIVSFNFNRLIDIDSSVMSIDYRYVYLSDINDALALIESTESAVLLDSSIPQHEKYYTIFNMLYNHPSLTDNDKSIMEDLEEKIQDSDIEARYMAIIDELKHSREQNIRTVLIEMYKPMGLTQIDQDGDRVFIAPSDYFYNIFSQVSLRFADETEGYYSPQFQIGDGENLQYQKNNFDSKLLATDPLVHQVEIDPETGERYAYVSVLLTHLSEGSCQYPVTIRFKAIVDQKGTVGGYPSQDEIEPFDINGNPRFLQGYPLPKKITIEYEKSGRVIFGDISSWKLLSPLQGFNEGDTISVIPAVNISVLNPSIIDFSINLPCGQGEYSYHISFPEKYIGRTKYNALAEDRRYRALDIRDGVMEIDNIYEIYDPNQPLGFDISKLPRTINPYQYAYGDVQFEIGGMLLDTAFEVTGNNAFDVEWRLVGDWLTGRKIDHNGTLVNIDGQLQIAPVLFAVAKLYSYYYYSIDDLDHPILLEQEIELYIKIKHMLNPIIEYEGLIDINDNNYISFDPYDDANNYGGNLMLPKDGLKVYFNNNPEDYHIFDARAILNYNLLMADSSNKGSERLYNLLMNRSATTNSEKMEYQRLLIAELIRQYASSMSIEKSQASETIMDIAFDAILDSSTLPLAQRQQQRRFFADFTVALLENNYGISSLDAWAKLMQVNSQLVERVPIITDYLYAFNKFSQADIITNIEGLLKGFQTMNESLSSQHKNEIIFMLYDTLSNTQKAYILDLMLGKNLYTQDIYTALEQISLEGQIINEMEKKAEALNRVMIAVDSNSKMDILTRFIEEDAFTNQVYLATGKSLRDSAYALLYRELVIACYQNTALIDRMSQALAQTINIWNETMDSCISNMWEIHLYSTIERDEITNIASLIELYISCSDEHSVSRFKEIIANRLINSYEFNDEEISIYYNKEGASVATEIFGIALSKITLQLAEWRITRAKSNVWKAISTGLENDEILARIIAGEEDNTEKLDTTNIYSLSYQRLKQSDIYPIFSEDIQALEVAITNPDPDIRRAMIFSTLYQNSMLSRKKMLIEIIVLAAYNISDTQQAVSVITYTQSGHNIVQVDDSVLYLYLYLPDLQRIDITLNIFSREIKQVLITNTITNMTEGGQSGQILPNIYYIDPYNADTFRLPEQAEFVFQTGYNLVLDIDEWLFEEDETFYTRTTEDVHKLFYYDLNSNSYRGGIYNLTSYLTYGRGPLAEKQYFTVTVLVLNRTLREEYTNNYHFDNPISGRVMDIPSSLSQDMFVDIDLYYKNVIPQEYYYSNFGQPIIPTINWGKNALNPDGIEDQDIEVIGGFNKNVLGYLSHSNSLIVNTYNKIWQEIYEETSLKAKPVAWEQFFEITPAGEKVVKTVFSGVMAEQITYLDNQIINELYLEAYEETYNNFIFPDIIDNLMSTLRNNNPGLYPEHSSDWFILFFTDIHAKARRNFLTENESLVWADLYANYVALHTRNSSYKKVEKWDQLMAMNLDTSQKNLALNNLDQAYLTYRNSMLIQAWDRLEKVVRKHEAVVMNEIINNLRNIYGGIEQAKIRAWNVLRYDDRIKYVIGESSSVNITAELWQFIDLIKDNEVIDEIIFNAFTRTTHETTYEALFEVFNSVISQQASDILQHLIYAYYDDFKHIALEELKQILVDALLIEFKEIEENTTSDKESWLSLHAKRIEDAIIPIDYTRADVEASGITNIYERDEIVWIRLLEGAGEWREAMENIFQQIVEEGTILPERRRHHAVERYRQYRLETLTNELLSMYDEMFTEKTKDTWDYILQNHNQFGESETAIRMILYRCVAERAWDKLYDISSGSERAVMDSNVYISDSTDVRYAYAWHRYYSEMLQSDIDRVKLMDNIMNYYLGYVQETEEYLGYGQVYIDIINNPQLVGETTQDLNELFEYIETVFEDSPAEFIIAEFIERLSLVNDEVYNLIKFYEDDLKRDAWCYFYEQAEQEQNNERLTMLDNLMEQMELEALSWQRLYQIKLAEALQEQEAINQLFEIVRVELIDKQLSKAYELQLINDSEALISIKEEYGVDEVKQLLWYRLYNLISPSEKSAMNSVLNTLVREGAIVGIDAEARSWDRLINKKEISNKTKQLMSSMLEEYIQARVLEIYQDQYIGNSQVYIDLCLESYKLSRIWDDIYAQTGDTHTLDTMYNNMLVQYPNVHEDIIKTYALKALFTSAYINTLIEDFEFLPEDEVDGYKAEEWDRIYESASHTRKASMDGIIANYSIYPPIKKKSLALDELLLSSVLTPQDKETVNSNIQQKKDKSLEIIVYNKAFEYLQNDSSHSSAVMIIFNNLLNRYSAFYQENELDIDEVNKQTVEAYARHLQVKAQEDISQLLDNALDISYQEFARITWDRYYQYTLENDEDNAELMQNILELSVTIILSELKAQAVEALYSQLLEDSILKIELVKQSIVDTLTKQIVWSQYFGEDLDALKMTLNNILTIDDNNVYLKHSAWQDMITYLASSSDINDYNMYNTMIAIRTRVYSENSILSNSEINALTYDTVLVEQPAIAQILIYDYTNALKNDAWNNLVAHYHNQEVILELFSEMYNLELFNHDNDEKLSKAICWDRMVGMVENIEHTLANIDPRFSAEELRAFAINCILEQLNGTESVVLLNAISDVDILMSDEEFDSLVFDYIYTENNSVLTEKYQQAEEDKPLALALYIEHLKMQAVSFLVGLAEETFNKNFEQLSQSEREELFDSFFSIKKMRTEDTYILQLALDSWENGEADCPWGRINIFWDEDALELSSDIASIYIGNAYKSYDFTIQKVNVASNVFVGENYLYRDRQIHVDYLDFHGELDIWSGDEVIDSKIYYNTLVIDPLNPYIPTTVNAYGQITDMQGDIEIQEDLYASYIGDIKVTFENRIYEYLYDDEGQNGELIRATVYPGLGLESQNVMIRVYYLDRRPIEYYVNSGHYTNEQIDDVLNLYPLTVDSNTGNNIMTIDPLNDSIYNVDTKTYMLPNSMAIMFTDAYAVEIISVLFMNGIFQRRMDISGIKWNLQGNLITLKGGDPFSITIDRYSVADNVIDSSNDMGIAFWQLKLKVIEKTPERVLKVNEQGLGGLLLASIKNNKLFAVSKVDPYNPMSMFSEHIRVEFLGGSESKVFNNIEWVFEEGRGLEFLQEEEVITGTLNENAMYLVAGFRCVSEMIWIQFPIQPRHIDTSESMLLGGTLYLIKGVDIAQQLARYNKLYYNFTEIGQEADWSEVPLEFDINSMQLININRVGTYDLEARLGPINDINISFIVHVIDPKLYAIDSNGNANPKIYYDSIPIAINTYGVRINGKEDEDGFLPNTFVQFDVVDDYGGVTMGYMEFNIINKVWDVANKQAIFTCQYISITDYDDDHLLACDSFLGKDLTFEIKVPLATYIYTDINETMQLGVESQDGTSILNHPLGEGLLLSQLPKAIINKGEEDEVQMSLLWDLSTINVNKAGTYVLYGYYRDYMSSYLVKSRTLVISIGKLDISDQILTSQSLVQTYNGLHVNIVPALPNVLRDNGIYTQLRLGREIIVEYITLEKYEMGELGEFRTTPYRDAGEYRVRITINDYNISGQRTFNLRISPIEIEPRDISFEHGQGSTIISVTIPNWPESYAEKEILYYNQLRSLVYLELGDDAVTRVKARAYDALLDSLIQEGQVFLNDRYNRLLEETYVDYDFESEEVQANMRRNIKALIWDQITPIGIRMGNVEERIISDWPISSSDKAVLVLEAKTQLEAEGIYYTESFAMAWAFDNLYNKSVVIVKDVMLGRLEYIIQTEFPNYEQASEAMKSSMLIEAKALAWQQIILTGFEGAPLMANWPISAVLKDTLINVQYEYILSVTYNSEDRAVFYSRAKSVAYDLLYERVYSTAQKKLENMFTTTLQQQFPNFDNYNEEAKQNAITSTKAMVWDNLIPNDTVEERSYIYDANEHMPNIVGLPQAKINGWPQTADEKTAMLEYARSESVYFTEKQAKARAYDNLTETIHSNVAALQKITNIINDILHTYYPEYYDMNIGYETRQELLVEAKARAWDTRIVHADTVEEIDYSFLFWYANMENEGMEIHSRPKNAGTYEVTLVIDPIINKNYALNSSNPIRTTISIRRGVIDQTFVNEMVYTGKPIKPICLGLHNQEGKLPDGVSISYTFRKDGQTVDHVRDVGQYTFSAVVDGGNNYPSWTINDQVFRVTKKDLIVNVGVVETGYLEEIKPLNSSVSLEGVVGDDLVSMFGYIVCNSNVTSKHMVGEYNINFIGFKENSNSQKIYYIDAPIPSDDVTRMNPVLFGNYNITVIDGTYNIKKANENAVIINNATELQQAYEQLQDGDSVLWYLAPNDDSYGDLVIDRNIGITIIGCYDVNIQDNDYSYLESPHDRRMSEVKDDALAIVTFFDSIMVNRGALTLDIISVNGQIDKSVVYVGKNTSSVTIKRCSFIHQEDFGAGGSPRPQNATAIMTSPSFKGLLRIENSYVSGFTAGVYLSSARKIEVINSRFAENRIAIRSFGGDTHIEGSRFEFSRDSALYLEMRDFIVINSSFYSNDVGIKSSSTNVYDLWLENIFSKNVHDTSSL